MIDQLKAQVHALGLDNKVYFTGYLAGKNVQKMYKCADVSVFPSTYEPFGIVAIEAMLSGNPVVVSDAGGLNEIVDHGINGMKSYCGNPNSLADSILTLLFNKDLAETCSKNAIEKVKAKYNWTKIASDTNFTYQKAICETMAERRAKQDAQEEFIKKSKKAGEITNLIAFKKSKEAFA